MGAFLPRFFWTGVKGGKINNMIGTTLTFGMKTQTSADAMGNPVMITSNIDVSDCLVAPITEPVTAREQQAIAQSRDQIRIHLPKDFTGDVSNSDVAWFGKIFHLDSDSIIFMEGNTPTRWNRYIRAECING